MSRCAQKLSRCPACASARVVRLLPVCSLPRHALPSVASPAPVVPFLCTRQWAHTFLTLKFLFYAVLLDGLRDSGYALAFCVAYAKLILDRFKNPDGLGRPALPVCYWRVFADVWPRAQASAL